MTVRRLLFLLVLGGLWCGAPTPTQAAEQPGDYTVTPQLPENQLQTTKSYFDLLVTPSAANVDRHLDQYQQAPCPL
ncbi:DUF916 domain-containing protein [Lacticaseibacillus nasuensis]|uniref:DUF916 domain-containing protein n=1 Tax=Lacticaseibacillus nasuensis TaxID=944671 RepID=UPI0006D0BBD6|nr:DUF916 domain-containing protein [Lacticaseibacillus nasuensis]